MNSLLYGIIGMYFTYFIFSGIGFCFIKKWGKRLFPTFFCSLIFVGLLSISSFFQDYIFWDILLKILSTASCIFFVFKCLKNQDKLYILKNKGVLFVLAFQIIALIICFFILYTKDSTKNIVQENLIVYALYTTSLILIAPFVEELCMRYITINILIHDTKEKKYKLSHIFVLICFGFFFALYHFFNSYNWYFVFYLSVLFIALNLFWYFCRRDSLFFVCMFCHTLWNVYSILTI